MGDVTALLEAVHRGQSGASGELFALVYDELKAIASGVARRQDAPLRTTELVHECFVRLAGGPQAKNRGHFYALAARAMRQILCDRARRTLAAKRGGGAAVSDEVEIVADLSATAAELVELDELFTQLAREDARAAQVLECRVFAGFTVPETAEALGISERTVHNDFDRARQWMMPRLRARASTVAPR